MRNLDWRWIGIGTAIMVGLNLVAGLILVALLGGAEALPADAAGMASTLADLAAEGLVVLTAASTMAAATGGVVLAVRAGRTCDEERAKEILRIAGATRIWAHDPAVGPAP